MKVTLTAYSNEGLGPSEDMTLRKSKTHKGSLLLSYPGGAFEVDGLQLWRAVLALMSDPEAHSLKDDRLVRF